MKFSIIAFVLFVSSFSFAQSPTVVPEKNETRTKLLKAESPLYTRLYLLNIDVRYDRDNDQQLSNRSPFHIAMGFKKSVYAAVVEYTNFSEESGNASSSVKRTHQEGVLWGRWHAVEFKGARHQFSFYGAGGLGLYQEEVTTTFLTDEVKDSGDFKMLGAAAIGGEWTILFGRKFGLVVNGELRLLAGSDFEPNPNFGGLVGLGLQF